MRLERWRQDTAGPYRLWGGVSEGEMTRFNLLFYRLLHLILPLSTLWPHLTSFPFCHSSQPGWVQFLSLLRHIPFSGFLLFYLILFLRNLFIYAAFTTSHNGLNVYSYSFICLSVSPTRIHKTRVFVEFLVVSSASKNCLTDSRHSISIWNK